MSLLHDLDDYKLETQFGKDPDCVLHTSYKSDRARGLRKVAVEEKWIPQDVELGAGTFGTVRLEKQFLDLQQKEAAHRAVKLLNKTQMERKNIDYKKELVALTKFSRSKNIFVVQKSPWWVKIGDFGISKRVSNDDTALHTATGTPHYLAPEVFHYVETGEDEETSSYTNAVDIWSFACVVYQMVALQVPFPNYPISLVKFCKDGAFPEPPLALRTSILGIDFIKKVLVALPQARPSAEDLLEEEWLHVEREERVEMATNSPKTTIDLGSTNDVPEQTTTISNFDNQTDESDQNTQTIRASQPSDNNNYFTPRGILEPARYIMDFVGRGTTIKSEGVSKANPRPSSATRPPSYTDGVRPGEVAYGTVEPQVEPRPEESQSYMARMSTALRRTPSPQQVFDGRRDKTDSNTKQTTSPTRSRSDVTKPVNPERIPTREDEAYKKWMKENLMVSNVSERPTYTRMSRRHTSLESLNAFNMDWILDYDPEYVLVKQKVPEEMQEWLFSHTARLRQRRIMEEDIRRIEDEEGRAYDMQWDMQWRQADEKASTSFDRSRHRHRDPYIIAPPIPPRLVKGENFDGFVPVARTRSPRLVGRQSVGRVVVVDDRPPRAERRQSPREHIVISNDSPSTNKHRHSMDKNWADAYESLQGEIEENGSGRQPSALSPRGYFLLSPSGREMKESSDGFPKKRKTRMPLGLVNTQAIIDLGYAFEREGDVIVIQKALGRAGIDEVIKLSEAYNAAEGYRALSEEQIKLPVRLAVEHHPEKIARLETDIADVDAKTRVLKEGEINKNKRKPRQRRHVHDSDDDQILMTISGSATGGQVMIGGSQFEIPKGGELEIKGGKEGPEFGRGLGYGLC
ncbi:hypothetical protein G7Y89_g3896 [Cudoniella acicularis]|uniref:non-specific serine/threonine protein kinase n=1 Tax=Cudoniella acicularis TaxID=354080 RepID=A0A8H4W5I7_9HELO|nr:hypothetical protein G7Y89_g3896 [Cudoniella acicularis]